MCQAPIWTLVIPSVSKTANNFAFGELHILEEEDRQLVKKMKDGRTPSMWQGRKVEQG